MAANSTERWMTPPPDGRLDFMTMADGARIRYGLWPAKDGVPIRGTVLFLNGRSEFIEKHFETVWDLWDRGFCVLTKDWRGQGLSTRATPNRSKDHIASFDIRLNDLGLLVERVLLRECSAPYHILAHSMGGHFAFRHLHDRPGIYEKAVMTAPMIGIHLGRIAEKVTQTLVAAARGIGAGASYAPGQGDYGDYQKGERLRNLLTSDRGRFQSEHDHIRGNPDLALGGVTYGWLAAAFRSMDRLMTGSYAEAIDIPVMIALSGRERVVDNNRIRALGSRLKDCRLVEFPDARHEILKERDEIRGAFWAAFDDFMQAGPQTA